MIQANQSKVIKRVIEDQKVVYFYGKVSVWLVNEFIDKGYTVIMSPKEVR